jgi:hypothetical protein
MAKPDPLQQLRIATPCETNWESMSGDDRVRYCGACDLNVYNFASMTRAEIGALLTATEGRVCARLYRRADGTLLTRDCRSLRVQRRRKLRLNRAALVALVSLSVFASSCTTRIGKQTSHMKIEVERLATAEAASLTGVVRDEAGFPFPGVKVVVRDQVTQREVSTTTDMNGAFSFPSLADGIYRVEVSLSGLMPMVRENLVLKQSEVVRAQVTFRFETSESVIVGAIVLDPTITSPGLTTTFSQEFINKVPIGN